jgi:hypothetical protein
MVPAHGQNPAVDVGVQCFEPAVKTFGEPGNILNGDALTLSNARFFMVCLPVPFLFGKNFR